MLIIVALMVASLSACGVKSSPLQPEGATYSQQYPAALPPMKATQPVAKSPQQRPLAPAVQPGAVYPNTARPAGS